MRTHAALPVAVALLFAFAFTAIALDAPVDVRARATRADYIFVSWSAVASASSYQVYRRSDDSGFSLIGIAVTPYYSDQTALAGTSYLYHVRAVSETAVSPDSAPALATTIVFADPFLTTGTIVRATHFTQLGSAVNAARKLAGLAPVAFDPLTAGTTTILRNHLVSLRSALDPARQTLSLGELTYTDSAITMGVTPVRRQHVSELRNGVNGAQRPGAVCDPGTGSCDGSSATYCNLDGTAFLQETCDPLQGMSCSSQSGQCEGACTAASLAALPNASLGCDFYPVVTANIVDSQFSFAAVISNPNDAAVTVTVTSGSDIVTSLSVAANGASVVTLPWIESLKGPDNAAFPASLVQTVGAYRLRATAPITVAQFSPVEYVRSGPVYSYSNDASLLRPAHLWGSKHRVASRAHWQSAGFSGFYSVTAKEDNTEVVITSPAGAVIKAGGGLPSSGSGTVTLHAGDVLEVVTADGAYDLSATLIESSKGVQVLGGHQCAQVPMDVGYCDHLEETMPPVATLSMSYALVAPATPTPALPVKVRLVRIIGTEDGTSLSYEPPQTGAPTIVNAGQVVEIAQTAASFVVTSAKPVLVAEYMTGQEAGGSVGDPSMMIATGIDRYQTSHEFTAPTSYEFNYVNIVAPTGTAVLLDGVALPTDDFTTIGSSGYSIARKLLSNSGSGRHTVQSAVPVGISVYGYGQGTSYWY